MAFALKQAASLQAGVAKPAARQQRSVACRATKYDEELVQVCCGHMPEGGNVAG